VGLDAVLCGGLPRHRIYLMEGKPGVGKTTIALQFLLEGVRCGESGLYITLSETTDELRAVAESHRWNLESIAVFELSAIEQQLRKDVENTFFHPSDVELNAATRIFLDEVERVKPARVVFDSLSELRLMAESPLRFRRQMLALKQFFAGRKCTVLFLDDQTSGDSDLQVRSIAHGVILLEKKSPGYGNSRRSLIVEKVRGSKYREGYHDFVVERGGAVVFPRLSAGLPSPPTVRATLSSGLEGLDLLLGGGLDRGTSTIFMGPPGTGKSSLAATFAQAAARQEEPVNYYAFDETANMLIDRARALGIDLKTHVESGRLCLQQIDPAEISPGEFSDRIRQSVEEAGTRLVIIDSINGYINSMMEDRHLNLQLHELLGYLSGQGVVTIMVLAQQGVIGAMHSVADLTYLADTVVMHRFFESAGEVRQAISVLKKRSGNHERTIRQFKIDHGGIHIGEPLHQFRGVLTGVPIFEGKASDIMQDDVRVPVGKQ
jgi:circadian clock protein KaiC